jgi:hypothetical protein
VRKNDVVKTIGLTVFDVRKIAKKFSRKGCQRIATHVAKIENRFEKKLAKLKNG